MGIDYTFSLCIGYEFTEGEVEKVFQKETKTEGKFHLEDRFDEKTGVKLKPVKVWDIKPERYIWLELDGEKAESVNEGFDVILQKHFNCSVDSTFNCTGDNTVIFSPIRKSKGRKQPAVDEGRVTVYENEISVEEVISLHIQLQELGAKLKLAGLPVGDAKVFISSSIG